MLRALRLLRQTAYIALGPLDYLLRVINGKRDLPPLHLRRHVGPLRSFEASAAEFQTYLRLLARLTPDESILDLGCGCGSMALTLKEFLDGGRYLGVDIHQPSINWCRRNIQSRYSNFEFLAINPNELSSESQQRFSLPYPDGAFDVILVKSVFTHLRATEANIYLSEIARLLSKRGRCLATFFLLNDQQAELKKRGLNAIAFDFGEEPSAQYAYQNSPQSAVAFCEGFVMDCLRKHKLNLAQPVIYGSWSGLTEGLSFQDLLLIERSKA